MHISIPALLCCIILQLQAVKGFAQDATVITRQSTLHGKSFSSEDLSKMGATNLSELLRFELSIEVERYPADGGARTRTFDLNSRYFKILVDGIPLIGSDMFGGHVDIAAITLNNVDSVYISYAPSTIEYGGGALTGIVNVITAKGCNTHKTKIQAFAQEESIGKEYNLRGGNAARGRHLQNLSVNQRLNKQLVAGANIAREAFSGYYGQYQGKSFISETSFRRGYEWSPYTSWNIDGFLSFEHKKTKFFYSYSSFHSNLTFYGHDVQQEWNENEPLNLFFTTDYKYVNSRTRHRITMQQELGKKTNLSLDFSFQDGRNKRRIAVVNTANNNPLNKEQLTTLHHARTFYGKAKVSGNLLEKWAWHAGVEVDRTNGYIAVAPGTYLSEEIDRNVWSMAGFAWLEWRPHSRWMMQPGIRVAGNSFSKAYPAPSVTLAYKAGGNDLVKLILEQTYRFPNHRELFTYLENDWNLLQGDEHLKPETGRAAWLLWEHSHSYAKAKQSLIRIQSGFRQLKNRIVIATAPNKIPTQEAFKYANVNEQFSWQNNADLCASLGNWKLETGLSLIALKGADYADADQYGKFLLHAGANAAVTWSATKGPWLRLNYRFAGSQHVYSFERELPEPELIRVDNRAKAWHLLDLNAGNSFLNGLLELNIGLRNLFNTKDINFYPVDGKEHYRGDLRTLFVGYGRGLYMRLSCHI